MHRRIQPIASQGQTLSLCPIPVFHPHSFTLCYRAWGVFPSGSLCMPGRLVFFARDCQKVKMYCVWQIWAVRSYIVHLACNYEFSNALEKTDFSHVGGMSPLVPLKCLWLCFLWLMTKTMAIQFYQSDMYSVSFANQTLLHYTLLIHFNYQ